MVIRFLALTWGWPVGFGPGTRITEVGNERDTPGEKTNRDRQERRARQGNMGSGTSKKRADKGKGEKPQSCTTGHRPGQTAPRVAMKNGLE